jgi:hypothetical protein
MCAGHTDGEPLWNWVHNTFFGPTREQSYLDNWDGELNDMVSALQEQVRQKQINNNIEQTNKQTIHQTTDIRQSNTIKQHRIMRTQTSDRRASNAKSMMGCLRQWFTKYAARIVR